MITSVDRLAYKDSLEERFSRYADHLTSLLRDVQSSSSKRRKQIKLKKWKTIKSDFSYGFNYIKDLSDISKENGMFTKEEIIRLLNFQHKMFNKISLALGGEE